MVYNEVIRIGIAIDSTGRGKMLILSTPLFASNIRKEYRENACSNMQHFKTDFLIGQLLKTSIHKFFKTPVR